MTRTSTDVDPLAAAWGPPADEDESERAARERAEAEAQRVSDRIDAELREERGVLRKKRKGLVKVLLLGQAESGKSTTLKNFQMLYAPAAWRAERSGWRAVIQLNLVRSVIAILDALAQDQRERELSADTPHTSPHASPYTPSGYVRALGAQSPPPPGGYARHARASLTRAASPAPSPASGSTSHTHQLLRIRLAPLRRVEADLKRALALEEGENTNRGRGGVVRSWRGALTRGRSTSTTSGSGKRVREARGGRSGIDAPIMEREGGEEGEEERGEAEGEGEMGEKGAGLDVDAASEVLAECRADMAALWADEGVREVLRKRRVRVEDQPGFFLDSIERVAARGYEPSDADVLRARLRTTGVQEHRFAFEGEVPLEHGSFLRSAVGREWALYDVGGCRTQRHSWLPYFDDLNAIIFLAPVSCFDEWLAEDPRVNRMEDSFMLWNTICASKLLQKVQIVLFMNKIDLLDRKLKAGAEVKRYMPSFGDRPCETGVLVKYLRTKFKDVLALKSPVARPFYGYPTSVIDTAATQTIIKSIRDGIIREQLKNTALVE